MGPGVETGLRLDMESPMRRGIGRSLSRNASLKVQNLYEDRDKKALSSMKRNLATRTMMHMFMRASLIEGCFMRLVQIAHSSMRNVEGDFGKLVALFEALGIPSEEIEFEEYNTCMYGPDGTVLSFQSIPNA
jgi:hypothetical protein